MKSAYELAMERLAKDAPEAAQPLSAEQKAALAELDRKYQAKIAEREVFLQQQLGKARAQGEFNEIEALEKQLRLERARLEEEREDAKERVRRGGR